jgi:hypothetical protein
LRTTEQRDDLAGALVGLCDRGDFDARPGARRHFLDLVRVHVEPRHEDHVLLAILDVDVPCASMVPMSPVRSAAIAAA